MRVGAALAMAGDGAIYHARRARIDVRDVDQPQNWICASRRLTVAQRNISPNDAVRLEPVPARRSCRPRIRGRVRFPAPGWDARQADRSLSDRRSSMARLGRTFLPDQPLHAIQRGNNRGAIFF